jgi:phosphatidylglycerophosphatase A
MNRLLLWLAQGFGLGRIPVAPGTFGSLAGLLWFALLLWTGNLWLFLAGAVTGLALSVWLCDVAETVLRQKDPGSVVIDEITAIPVSFLGWIIILVGQTGALPAPEHFLAKHTWPLTAGVFVLFRLFDIVKPWPVRGSQALPGGWGVTVDDALAALYVNVVVLGAYGGEVLFGR